MYHCTHNDFRMNSKQFRFGNSSTQITEQNSPNNSVRDSVILCSHFLPRPIPETIRFGNHRAGITENLYRAKERGGFGSQTAADPLWWPPQNPWKADRGYCDSISKNAQPASVFELSQCRPCKGGLPGPRRGLGCPPAVCSPERPHPFTHYRENSSKIVKFGAVIFLGSANLFTKCLFTIFVPLNPPPQSAKWWTSSWPQTELRTLSQNCEQTSKNCKQTELWTNKRFWLCV